MFVSCRIIFKTHFMSQQCDASLQRVQFFDFYFNLLYDNKSSCIRVNYYQLNCMSLPTELVICWFTFKLVTHGGINPVNVQVCMNA